MMEYLPLFPPAIRAQALRLLAQLLDHGCSIENNQGERPVKSHYHGEI